MRRARTLDEVPDYLWRLVSLASGRLLMLDFDGTLAPFNVARDMARPLPRSVELLGRIASEARTRVAIVSGRPVREIERLLGPLPAVLFGEHGWERRAVDGWLAQEANPPGASEEIEQPDRRARTACWGDMIERKRPTVVLHTRSLPRDQALALEEECVEAWKGLAATGHVVMDRIDGGVELRARGRDKGFVVESLLSESPPGTLGVFVGDDITDEDAFEAVRDRGFSVRVGEASRESSAMALVPTVEAVADFLEEWLAVVRAATGPAS